MFPNVQTICYFWILFIYVYLTVMGDSFGMQGLVAWPGIKLRPLRRECGVLTTGLPGKSLAAHTYTGLLAVLVVRKLPASAGDMRRVRFLGDDPLEEGMATYSSIFAQRIPWTEEPVRLQSKGLQRVQHDWSDLACTHYYKMCLYHF